MSIHIVMYGGGRKGVRIRDPPQTPGVEERSFICEEEPHMVSLYRGFGYFPLKIGQRLNKDKYEIVRKLGWGEFSSVWLAKTLDGPDAGRYVAIKVLSVNETSGIVDNLVCEMDIMRLVTSKNPAHPGYKHCITLREWFLASSYHGPHICMVTDPLGWTLEDLQFFQPGHTFTLPVTKRIVKQLLLAIDYLHRECAAMHVDLKPSNLMVSVENDEGKITSFLEQNPSSTYDPPLFEPDLSPDPIVTVRSQPIPNFGLDKSLNNLSIKLADYGNGILDGRGRRSEDQMQPVGYEAPEVLLGYPWSAPVDIWSIGCLAFECLALPLLQVYGLPIHSYRDAYLQGIIRTIGAFPPDFLATCSKSADYFDNKGNLLRAQPEMPPQPGSIEDELRSRTTLDEKDILATGAFLRRCLTIDPSRRPTALQLLDDDWFEGVD
ncbi:kinase-like domain-containing protein [Gloeopeniophorella convolvens]|nr:kinase-like domain-containing protein [Gloeopeniophorella convolvens]